MHSNSVASRKSPRTTQSQADPCPNGCPRVSWLRSELNSWQNHSGMCSTASIRIASTPSRIHSLISPLMESGKQLFQSRRVGSVSGSAFLLFLATGKRSIIRKKMISLLNSASEWMIGPGRGRVCGVHWFVFERHRHAPDTTAL
jgi:hypothetical protein